jgi:C-terminal processing protease CtpA/Prc
MPYNPIHFEINKHIPLVNYDHVELIVVHIIKESPYKGIGIILQYGDGNGLVVDEIMEDGYAYTSNQFKVGDDFVRVNGISVMGDEQMAISLLREERELHIELYRNPIQDI